MTSKETPEWGVDSPDIVGYVNMMGVASKANAARTAWMSNSANNPHPVVDWGEMDDDTDDSTPRAGPSYPHPALSLPVPTLDLDFRMSVTLKPVITVGAAPSGFRRWVSFTGGSWSGSFGSGFVQPGGQDIQVITPSRSAKLSTTYLLQTSDSPPAYIIARTTGWRTGSKEVLASLDDPEKADGVDPRSYKFRIFVELETGDERYAETVNTGLWVGSGMRKGLEVIYDAYRVN